MQRQGFHTRAAAEPKGIKRGFRFDRRERKIDLICYLVSLLFIIIKISIKSRRERREARRKSWEVSMISLPAEPESLIKIFYWPDDGGSVVDGDFTSAN